MAPLRAVSRPQDMPKTGINGCRPKNAPKKSKFLMNELRNVFDLKGFVICMQSYSRKLRT